MIQPGKRFAWLFFIAGCILREGRSTMNDVIEVNQAIKKFSSFTALKGIDLRVRKGEILGLVGPSGSGKTTLVKVIAGTEAVTKGGVTVFGKCMPSLTAMAQIGYMAQSDALYPDLNAYDHLNFFGALYGLKSASLKQRIDIVLQMVELEQHSKKSVHSFSGGMKRRLSLAIALLHEPKLLVLDEPTVGLDPVLRRKFWSEFLRLKETGVTILITTHVMDEAERCDRLGLIRDGSLLTVEPPSDLKERLQVPTIEDAFLRLSEVNVS
jgi:ABC-2 type transport system ATP-binding protein